MPRLSIFSWDGSDNDDSNSPNILDQRPTEIVKAVFKQKYPPSTIRKRSTLARHMVNSVFRPSAMLLDKTPDAPSDKNPSPRCVNPRWKATSMQLLLRIMASSDHRKLSQRELIRHNVCIATAPTFPYLPHSKNGLLMEQDGTVYRRSVVTNILLDRPFCIRNLHLSELRPLQAPFVPTLIRILVSSIENDCKASSWKVCFEDLSHLKLEAQNNVRRLIRVRYDKNRLTDIISDWSTPIKTATLRVFLGAIPIKPLHMSKAMLKRFIKRPLYDQFLRPNPQIKAFVRQIVLPKTRTELDTLAFLMTHIIHAWDSSPGGFKTRAKLADIYGPLLISFSERPIIVDRDVSSNKTEEAALMEVILDVCDGPFWNHLSMLQIHKAFGRNQQEVSLLKYHKRLAQLQP
ncbi:hypothetical protein D915_007772 [Fasciola hepatica]|uniref:Uncharacterized protein n=1 Tax=Fasciola hepatica TaxID=6192 RepID=A0A4E0RL57_FASHE|nr:hypothetical protein D915_007772 [Fasciola hepatica]